MPNKAALVSGIQPTGRLHIGNYLGALKNFVELQNSGKYKCYFFIADLHSLTEEFKPQIKSQQVLELTADFLAAGLDPKKSVIFLQSQVPAHTELAWILSTMTPMGELERMTQFKDKTQIKDDTLNLAKNFFEKWRLKREFKEIHGKLRWKKDGKVISIPEPIMSKLLLVMIGNYVNRRESVNLGLLAYPTLMAADILLYDPKFVPVGDDQKQHLELTRSIARKFNSRFGKTFTEPQPLFTNAPRIMNLGEPKRKMSKSKSHPQNVLYLDDSPEDIKSKIKGAVTDSGSEIRYDEKRKPAISNLIQIYASFSGKTVKDVEKKFRGKTYSEFKDNLAKLIIDSLSNFRKKKKSLLASAKGGSASGGNSSKLKAILYSGSKEAYKIASKKISEVKKKIGLEL